MRITMKVILLSDVAKVGKKYDTVDVAPGYARNFLLARGLGEAITKVNGKRVAEMTKKRETEKKKQIDLLDRSLAGVPKVALTITRKANEEGHLYAGVTRDELAQLLAKELHALFTADNIDLEKPIKEVGKFKITVLVGEKKAEFDLAVEAESDEEESSK